MDRTLELLMATLCTLWIMWGASTCAVQCSRAKAEDKTKLHLAQCLMAETSGYSGYKNTEWAAHAWVLKKRKIKRGVSLDVSITEYCAVFDKRGYTFYKSRSKKIRATTMENIFFGSQKRWAALFAWVDIFLQGKVKDPCPAAMHFGTDSDVGEKPLIEVCHWLGKRGNKFYRVKR